MNRPFKLIGKPHHYESFSQDVKEFGYKLNSVVSGGEACYSTSPKIIIDTSNVFSLPDQYMEALNFAKEQAKPKYEVGKWYYWTPGGHEGADWGIARFVKLEDEHFYFNEAYKIEFGTIVNDDRFVKHNSFFNNIIQGPATPQQLEEILTKVAESKGFKEGIKVDRHNFETIFPGKITIDNFYYSCDPYHYDILQDQFLLKGYIIYEKGKWAEILPEEFYLNGHKVEFLESGQMKINDILIYTAQLAPAIYLESIGVIKVENIEEVKKLYKRA